MDELDILLADFDESQMSGLLENVEVEIDEDLSSKIKAQVIPTLFEEEKEKKIRLFTPRRIFMAAASLVAVISAAVALVMYYEPSEVAPVTTQAPTVSTTANADPTLNPLMLAISKGDESLIDMLVSNTVLVTKDVLQFALDCADAISYESIQKIASATVETLGSTGLDALLESTLLGDSKRALEELEKRENMLMTPLEKLSFFFSVAFCDSEVVRGFLNKGYSADITREDGKTVYEIAEEYGNGENAVLISEFAEK